MVLVSLPQTGWLATCGIVEGRDGLMEPASLAEATECCVDLCKDAQEECYDYCDSAEECDDCVVENRVCVEACLNPIANSHYSDYYSLCARGYGCVTETGIDGDCAEKHSNAILECCRYACIPMGNVECEGCKYMEQIALRDKADHKKTYKGSRKHTTSKIDDSSKNASYSTSDLTWHVVFVVGILILIIGVILVLSVFRN